jgi:addiction module HigA family antidote
MPISNPPHPGEFIRTEILEPLGLSVTSAAQVLGVSRPALSSLLNGKADLSGEMAIRIEKAFGPKMDTLMRMQFAYDIVRTRKREREVHVRRYRPAAMQAFVGSRKERPEFHDSVESVRSLRRGSRMERLGKR